MDETLHDPYRDKMKMRSPAVCSTCRAVYLAGRWQWGDEPPAADAVICPACQRKRDDVPAGTVRIGGEFYLPNRRAIMDVVQALEARVKAEHPLSRIMKIETLEDRALVHTTDFHLARQIGDALEKAYHGTLEYHYSDHDAHLDLRWTR
jgi:hypothetical protein